MPLLEIDIANEYFEDWADARITQTMGQRQLRNAGISSGGPNVNVNGTSNLIVQPIVYVTMQQIPCTTVDKMDLAFHRGATRKNVGLRHSTPTSTKHTDKQ